MLSMGTVSLADWQVMADQLAEKGDMRAKRLTELCIPSRLEARGLFEDRGTRALFIARQHVTGWRGPLVRALRVQAAPLVALDGHELRGLGVKRRKAVRLLVRELVWVPLVAARDEFLDLPNWRSQAARWTESHVAGSRIGRTTRVPATFARPQTRLGELLCYVRDFGPGQRGPVGFMDSAVRALKIAGGQAAVDALGDCIFGHLLPKEAV